MNFGDVVSGGWFRDEFVVAVGDCGVGLVRIWRKFLVSIMGHLPRERSLLQVLRVIRYINSLIITQQNPDKTPTNTPMSNHQKLKENHHPTPIAMLL